MLLSLLLHSHSHTHTHLHTHTRVHTHGLTSVPTHTHTHTPYTPVPDKPSACRWSLTWISRIECNHYDHNGWHILHRGKTKPTDYLRLFHNSRVRKQNDRGHWLEVLRKGSIKWSGPDRRHTPRIHRRREIFICSRNYFGWMLHQTVLMRVEILTCWIYTKQVSATGRKKQQNNPPATSQTRQHRVKYNLWRSRQSASFASNVKTNCQVQQWHGTGRDLANGFSQTTTTTATHFGTSILRNRH